MTALIESTRQAIADAIRDFESPVPGLTFNDEMLILTFFVTLQGELR